MSKFEHLFCTDCNQDIDELNEYAYMLHDHIWRQLCKKTDAKYLCVACVETRLNRRLRLNDFNLSIPLTTFSCFDRSERLLNRVGKGIEFVNSLDYKTYEIWVDKYRLKNLKKLGIYLLKNLTYSKKLGEPHGN